ncbi:MAG: hypothetical protein QM689_03095 [Oscillospiraceae bacterium]
MPIVGIIFAAVMLISVLGGANFYVGRKIYQWLSIFLPHMNAKLYIAVYIALVIIMILGFVRTALPVPVVVKTILNWVNMYWAGIFAFLLMLFLVSDFAFLLGTIVKIIPQPLPSTIHSLQVCLCLC